MAKVSPLRSSDDESDEKRESISMDSGSIRGGGGGGLLVDILAFFTGFGSGCETDWACEAVLFLWLGSHRTFFRRQASQALMIRIRCA
jgi:hypothetical protein